jgi:Putative addiction module component
MNSHVKRLTVEASKLPLEDQVELLDALLNRLEAAYPDLDRKWVEESTDRLGAYRRGEIEAFDMDAALAKRRTTAARP